MWGAEEGGVEERRWEERGRGRRGCLIYWFNSCQCLSLSFSVREGKWSVQPKTLRPNRIFSHFHRLSLSLSLCLASLCLSLAPSLTPSPSFFHLSMAFFSLFVTRLMTDSRSPRPSARWKWNLSNPPLMEFVKLNRVFVLNCLHNQTFETQNSRTLRTKAHSKHWWLMNVKCDGVYPGWVNCLVLFF